MVAPQDLLRIAPQGIPVIYLKARGTTRKGCEHPDVAHRMRGRVLDGWRVEASQRPRGFKSQCVGKVPTLLSGVMQHRGVLDEARAAAFTVAPLWAPLSRRGRLPVVNSHIEKRKV